MRTLQRVATDTTPLAQEQATRSHEAFMSGDVHGAIAHQRRAIALFPNDQLKGQALVMLAQYHGVLLDWRASVDTQHEAIATLQRVPVSPFIEQLLAEAYAYAGWDRVYLDEAQAAIPELERGLALATTHQLTELVAVAQLGLGRAWLAR